MMKINNIILLPITILLLACTNTESRKNTSIINFKSGFSLYQDTISVNIKGEMTHAIKYHDKFYILFEQRVLKYGGYSKRWLYIISNGQIEKVIECPKEMETTYLDFYVQNDRLILKPYMEKQCYHFDLNNYHWIKISKTDDLIFEDDKFQVYSLNFGEWGGKTWFRDKKTGSEYIIESTTPLINRIDSVYYLTSPFKVIKINNPAKLNKCNESITYENIEKSKKYFSWYADSIGYNTIYQDTTFDYFDNKYRPYIVSSFVLNNELSHIYETDTATYIAKVENNTIKLIQKLVENISFYNWHYSYRCVNLDGNNELLKFKTNKERLFGLMEIVDNKIQIHYFVNRAILEPRFMGTQRADSIFFCRLNIYISDFNNLKLNTIDLKEQDWGTFDITPNHHIGIANSWNYNNYIIDTCRSYLIKEDSIISNSLMYYGTKENNSVRIVTIDWDYERDYLKLNSEKLAKKSFDKKVGFLIDCISQYVGKQIKRSDKKNYYRITWETPAGILLELESNTINYSTSLVIYKK